MEERKGKEREQLCDIFIVVLFLAEFPFLGKRGIFQIWFGESFVNVYTKKNIDHRREFDGLESLLTRTIHSKTKN